MGDRLRVDDLNFDGAVDLLIAATDGNSDRNRLYLAFGPITGPLDMTSPGATHVLIEGANTRDGFGDGVITGQFDSDGQLDLLVSAPAWASTTKGDNYGALSFFEGPIKNDLSATSPDHRLELFSRASIGRAALANLGDIDSDGLDDVAIGLTPWTYNVGTKDYPRDIVAVVTDGAVTSATDIWDAVSWSVIVESVGDDLGVVLVPAGDLDGDGYAELVVGAPGRDVGDDDSGTAWVISGKELNRSGVGYTDIEDAAIAEITGNYETDQHVGAALTAPGDLDQDGLGDLLIGAPGYDSDGGAFIVYGPVSGHLQEKDLGRADRGARHHGRRLRRRAGRPRRHQRPRPPRSAALRPREVHLAPLVHRRAVTRPPRGGLWRRHGESTQRRRAHNRPGDRARRGGAHRGPSRHLRRGRRGRPGRARRLGRARGLGRRAGGPARAT
jgi:hypothetical protein